jgi:hypothetical protein
MSLDVRTIRKIHKMAASMFIPKTFHSCGVLDVIRFTHDHINEIKNFWNNVNGGLTLKNSFFR